MWVSITHTLIVFLVRIINILHEFRLHFLLFLISSISRLRVIVLIQILRILVTHICPSQVNKASIFLYVTSLRPENQSFNFLIFNRLINFINKLCTSFLLPHSLILIFLFIFSLKISTICFFGIWTYKNIRFPMRIIIIQTFYRVNISYLFIFKMFNTTLLIRYSKPLISH